MQRAQRCSALAVPSSWSSRSYSLPTQTRNHLSRWASSVPSFNLEYSDVKGKQGTERRRNPTFVNRLRLESLQDGLDLHGNKQIIIPDSLAETLRAHREANRDSIIIRKRKSSGAGNVPSSHFKVPNEALRLELDRDTKQKGSRNVNRRRQEEYQGQIRGLAMDWEIIGDIARYMAHPWMRSLYEQGETRDLAVERLSKEIRAADAFFTPTAKEVTAAARAVKDIESAVTTASPLFAKLDLIGSRASGLATPLSDLDLNLLANHRPGRSSENSSTDTLSVLFRTMKFGKKKVENPTIETSYFAANARVPIIVGLHGPSGLEFQIQSASSGYGTLETVKCLAAEYPTLTPLFKILKQTLKMRGLADGARGGLTSYPLLIMIAVSLKQNAARSDPYDVATHLLQFLEFYSELDFYNTGITHTPSNHLKLPATNVTAASQFADEETALATISLVTQDPVGAIPMLFDTKHKMTMIHRPKNNFMMTLHDPANPYNDLGRSAYWIKHIQATFMDIHSKLKELMFKWDACIRAEGQTTKTPPSLLSPLIRGDYSMYNLERTRLSSWLDDKISPKS